MNSDKLIERLIFEQRLGCKDIPVEDVMQLVMDANGWISIHTNLPGENVRELPVDVMLDDGTIGEAFYAPIEHKSNWLYRDKKNPPQPNAYRNIMYTGRHVVYWRPYQPQPLPAPAADGGMLTIKVLPGSFVIPPDDVGTVKTSLQGYLEIIRKSAAGLLPHDKKNAHMVMSELHRIIMLIRQ